MNEAELERVDHSALRTNQAVIIGLSILAYILESPWLAGIVAVVMLTGTLFQRPGFGFIYQSIRKSTGWVKPEILLDHPEPHRFAQGFGGMVMSAAGIAFLIHLNGIGWALVWAVIALAALNLFGGFCIGCAVYYWLGRIQVRGFDKHPPEGVVPGMRPKAGSR